MLEPTSPGSERFDLETGETAVLSLSLARDHDEVLVDEESVREVARVHDLQPRRTLSFPFTGIQNGDLDFDGSLEHLERFLEQGFYLVEAVYLEAIRKARQLDDSETNA